MFLQYLVYWVFSIRHCWILSKAFSASIEIIMWFLFLVLFMWWITFIDLRMLNQPCIPGMNPTWLCWISFLICCCNRLANITLRIFASMFIRNIGLKISFFCISARFCYQFDAGLIKWVREASILILLFEIFSEGVVPAPLCTSGRILLWIHLS